MSKKRKDTTLDDYLSQVTKARETPANEKVLYLANGIVVALAPVYLYATIFGLPLKENALVFLALTAVAAFLLSQAYETVSKSVYISFSRGRNLPEANLEANNDLQSEEKEPTKKDLKKKEALQLQTQQAEVSRHEAISFSLLYNNLLFLLFVVVLGFFALKNLPGLFNYILSVGVSGALVMLSSQSK